MASRRSLPCFALPLLALLPVAASATHEANHRYRVTGYVLDAERQPLANVPVSIDLGRRLVGSAHTDDAGYYSVHLHLHDSDIGSDLRIRAGKDVGTVRMRGRVGDRYTARVHHVNFVGGVLDEQDLGSPGMPVWFYAGGAALLAAAIGFGFYLRRRWRAIRRAAHAAAPKPATKRKKRKRRGKRG